MNRDTLGNVVFGMWTLGIIVCHIMVIVKMFRNGQSGLGIVTIITTCFVPGIGVLFCLIYGWVYSNAWKIKRLMIIFTVLFSLWVVVVTVHPPTFFHFLRWVLRVLGLR